MEEYTKGEWRVWENLINYVVNCEDQTVAFCEGKESQANAHLIASAPDLYEALKQASIVIFNSIRYAEGEHRAALQRELKQVEQALAKAEGK